MAGIVGRFVRVVLLVSLVVLASTVPHQVAAQSGDCTTLCGSCGWPLVIVTNGQPGNSQMYNSPLCYFGPCEGTGCVYTGDEQDLDMAMEAIDQHDTMALAEIVRRNQNFVINENRGSLQLVSRCDLGAVTADIPLNAGELMALGPAVEGHHPTATAAATTPEPRPRSQQ